MSSSHHAQTVMPQELLDSAACSFVPAHPAPKPPQTYTVECKSCAPNAMQCKSPKLAGLLSRVVVSWQFIKFNKGKSVHPECTSVISYFVARSFLQFLPSKCFSFVFHAFQSHLLRIERGYIGGLAKAGHAAFAVAQRAETAHFAEHCRPLNRL